MKVWSGYGSEHSMNLKLIGHFAEASEARAAADAIGILTEAATKARDAGELIVGEPLERFSEQLLRAMSEVNVYSFGHADVEQLLYEAAVQVDDADVVVTTDEIDVLAYVKVLIGKGARIEIYSMHDFDAPAVGDE